MPLNKHLFTYLPCLFVFVFINLIISSTFLSPNTHAYNLSISASDISVDVISGKTSIKESEIEIISDCRAGYNFSVSTSHSPSLYLNGDDTGSAVFNAVDGTNTLASSNNLNKWGYYYNASSIGTTNAPTESSIFSPLSTTPVSILTTSDTASPSADIDDVFSIYYGVNTSDSVIPGIYAMSDGDNTNSTNGTINYYATMDYDCEGFTIEFNANGGTGTMTNQTIHTGLSTKLKANGFTAPAIGTSYTDANNNTVPGTAGKLWTFWGWNTEVDGTGDWYKDRESVLDLEQSGSSLTLYAQWKQSTLADLTTSTPGQNKTIDHNTMQDMSPAACYNSEKFTAIGTPYGQATLTDNRDGTTRTYTVAKLPDGYCWMTQNLNLGASTAITLTSDDTDLEDGTTFTLPASDSTDFSTSTTEENYNKPTVLNNMTVPNYTVNGTTYSGKINAYYSYAAATADTSTYSKSDETIVSNSICPKNWDLPTAKQYSDLKTKGDINTYNNTDASYAGKNAGNEPYYFIYGGYRKAAGSTVNTTYFTNPTTYSYLWTANNYNASYGRGASVYSSGLNNTTSYKYYGLGIRCVSNMDEVMAKITFVNTDTGETQTQTIGVLGENSTIQIQPPTTWTKSGYGLAGWDTNSSGTNAVYVNEQTITSSSDITLYTAWKLPYTIQYNGNGADAGVMTNVKHTNVVENDVFDLFASNYSKAGYGFAGWSFDPNAQPGGASRIYGPNEAITAPAGTAGETKTLYAVWVQSAGNLQDWQGCSTMSIGDVTALKDTRDNQVYTVGKLADDNCWMMENLRLDAANSSDSTKAQGFGGVFVGLANSEDVSKFSIESAANSLYSTINILGSNQGYRFPRYNNSNTSSRAINPSAIDDRFVATSTHATSLVSAIYSYGNYYSWAAAKANTEILDTSVNTSICPSGWILPAGGGQYGFGQLAKTLYGSYYMSGEEASRSFRAYPNNFIFAGSFINSTNSEEYYGSYGHYWSSTKGDNTHAFALELDVYYRENIVAPNYNTYRYEGYSIRCVAEEGFEVKLMLNDGTGRVGGRIYGDAGSAVTLPTPTRENYKFKSWNTAADGSGNSYTGSYTFDPSAITGITLYAQWLPTYIVQYDGNGADNASTGMGSTDTTTGIKTVRHTNVAEGDTFHLFTSNFKRAGYGFVGWSTDSNAWSKLTDNDTTNDAKIWGPNEMFTAPASNGTSITTLYAVWAPAETSGGNPVYLQNWTGCSSMTSTTYNSSTGTLTVAKNSITALTDQRDGEVYAIARLADLNCWMIENLRLADTHTENGNTVATTLSTSNTNILSSNNTLPITNIYNDDSSLATTSYSLSPTSSVAYNASSAPYGWCNANSAACFNQSRLNTTNTTSTTTPARVQNITSADAFLAFNTTAYSYGNYYNWYSATAGYGTYDKSSGVTDGDICPIGWHLPYGGSAGGNTRGGFYFLADRMSATSSSASNANKFSKFPNNFVYSSSWLNSSAASRGTWGEYWSSTANNNNTAYYFSFSPSVLYPGTGTPSNKYYGRTVRCVKNS